MVKLILSDGLVTESERRDLERVAQLLDIRKSVLEAALSDPKEIDDLPTDDLTGKSVCFTGTFRCEYQGKTKATAAKLSEAAGLHVRGTVTKKLDILVTTDPLSSSGKAKKARDYGIRILAERAF